MLRNDIKIKNVNSIKKIQKDYKTDFEKKSIAQELIQNSLNERQKGHIKIYDNLILLQIENINKNNIEETVKKINEGVIKAKECYQNSEKRIQSLGKHQKHLKSHGRGFLSILHFGWDIVTLQNNKKLLIAAIKV